MTFREKVRTWWEARRRDHAEKEEDKLAAEARGDTYTLGQHKADTPIPSRGQEPPRRE
jgi:hypothetical protein